LERVREGQFFHFAVVAPAPISSRQKGPSYFNLRFLWIVAVKSGRSDDLLSFLINDDKRSAGFEGFSKEDFEHKLLVAIALRVLLPNEWIGCDGEQIVPIFRCQRTKLDELACEMWLEIK